MASYLTPLQGIKSWCNEGFKQAPGAGQFGAGVQTFNPGGFMQGQQVSVHRSKHKYPWLTGIQDPQEPIACVSPSTTSHQSHLQLVPEGLVFRSTMGTYV